MISKEEIDNNFKKELLDSCIKYNESVSLVMIDNELEIHCFDNYIQAEEFIKYLLLGGYSKGANFKIITLGCREVNTTQLMEEMNQYLKGEK